jgi:Spy/CpxP family protein refolding chaperone
VGLFVLAMLGAAPVGAADRPAVRPGTRPATQRVDPMARLEQYKRIAAELGLTDAQKEKLDAVFAEARAQLEAMTAEFQKNNTPPDERMARMRKWSDEMRAKAESLLDDKQKAAFAEKVNQMRGAGMFANALERVQRALDEVRPTDEQKQKIAELMAQARSKFAEIRAQAGGDVRALGEKLRGVLDEMRERLKTVLTPEQQEKIKGLLEPRGERPQTLPAPPPPPGAN